jgi:hypothetical protein
VYDKTKDEITFQPSDDFKIWQKNMAELYLKQKEKGGIIDVDAEKNRYLLTDSDVRFVSLLLIIADFFSADWTCNLTIT